MSFIAVLFALLLEQLKPMGAGHPVFRVARAWAHWCSANLDAGGRGHLSLAWSVALVVPVLLALGIFLLLQNLVGWPLALIWNAMLLYVCLGFRQFSFHFTEIRQALNQGDRRSARQSLAQWQGVDEATLSDRELVARLVETSVLAAHRHVFGVLTWFSLAAALGLGPSGAVAYRMAEWLARSWPRADKAEETGDVAERAHRAETLWQVVDWLPARVTAISFAVVGNFEDALEGWRRNLQGAERNPDQVILAASAGALGFQLPSVDIDQTGAATDAKPLPEPDHLAAVVGLVWRTVVMWMVLLALLTLARLLG
jgi:adenosylcobinamide-phosphate synthase